MENEYDFRVKVWNKRNHPTWDYPEDQTYLTSDRTRRPLGNFAGHLSKAAETCQEYCSGSGGSLTQKELLHCRRYHCALPIYTSSRGDSKPKPRNESGRPNRHYRSASPPRNPEWETKYAPDLPGVSDNYHQHLYESDPVRGTRTEPYRDIARTQPYTDRTQPYSDRTQPYSDRTQPYSDRTQQSDDRTKPYNDRTRRPNSEMDRYGVPGQLPKYGEEYTKRIRYLAHNDGQITPLCVHLVNNPEYACTKKGCCSYRKPSPYKKVRKPFIGRRDESPFGYNRRVVRPSSIGRFPIDSELTHAQEVDRRRYATLARQNDAYSPQNDAYSRGNEAYSRQNDAYLRQNDAYFDRTDPFSEGNRLNDFNRVTYFNRTHTPVLGRDSGDLYPDFTPNRFNS